MTMEYRYNKPRDLSFIPYGRFPQPLEKGIYNYVTPPGQLTKEMFVWTWDGLLSIEKWIGPSDDYYRGGKIYRRSFNIANFFDMSDDFYPMMGERRDGIDLIFTLAGAYATIEYFDVNAIIFVKDGEDKENCISHIVKKLYGHFALSIIGDNDCIDVRDGDSLNAMAEYYYTLKKRKSTPPAGFPAKKKVSVEVVAGGETYETISIQDASIYLSLSIEKIHSLIRGGYLKLAPGTRAKSIVLDKKIFPNLLMQ